MNHSKLGSTFLRMLGFIVIFALSAHLSASTKNDSTSRTQSEQDSLFQQEQTGTPSVRKKTTKQDVSSDKVNYRDIVKQESLRPPKRSEPRAAPSHIHPKKSKRQEIPDPNRLKKDSLETKGRMIPEKISPDSTSFPKTTEPTVDSIEQIPQSYNLQNIFPLSPSPDTNFHALADNNGYIPPDVNGGVGLTHLMVAHNTQVRVQDRQGRTTSINSLNGWWTGIADSAFDPRVIFDPYKRRWIFTAVAYSYSPNSSLLLAISQTSDPMGPWWRHRIDVDPAGIAWADYPSIGFNKKWLCITVNMIQFGLLASIDTYLFDKNSLYAGAAPNFFTNYTVFEIDDWNVHSITPAVTFEDTLSVLYLASSADSFFSWYSKFYSVDGNVGGEVFHFGPRVTGNLGNWRECPVSGNYTICGEDFLPQLGTTRRIATVDVRMKGVVYRNGALWCVHTIYKPNYTPDHSLIQWWKVYALSGLYNISLLQQGRIGDSVGTVFHDYPSIAVNINDDVLIGHGRFSPNQYASGNYSYRTAGDPPNTMQVDAVLKAGEAPYNKDFNTGKNKWGDYTTTMVDPLNDFALWTIQEYAAPRVAGSDRWGTWWGRIGDLHCPVAKGDLDINGSILPSDVVRLLQATFRDGTFPAPFCTSDLDCNRSLTRNDVDIMLTLAFGGQQPPPCEYQY